MAKREEQDFTCLENTDKKIVLVLSILSLILIITLFSFLFLYGLKENEKLNLCGDGTPYSSCSKDKPYYCESGKLVEKSSLCGCPDFLISKQEKCVLQENSSAKENSFEYVLNGEVNSISIPVYEDIYSHVTEIDRFISYGENETPLRRDFKIKKINNDLQREFILPLVKEIQNSAPTKLTQARISISLVQNIPWKVSEKDKLFSGSRAYYSRYPYEVIYENEGVCGEKSELLALILKELGYETAIFYFQQENHESLGIKCPLLESFKSTGYCFVETSGPSIISDSSISYAGGIVLDSNPEVIEISEGESLPFGIYEYFDKFKMAFTRTSLVPEKIRNYIFLKLQKKYGLTESYYLS
ncbi:MAG TPA: hypothetical protein PLK34_00225 [Candidatus Pacearchaeota archaeon]|nr:hypothetical protein [Candidatus Pacearchaeota archaeon]